MTIEERAESCRGKYLQFDYTEDEAMAFDIGYEAGAKENGIMWHDLRKDPNDLPRLGYNKKYSIKVLTCFGSRRPTQTGFYNHSSRQWEDGTEHVTYTPIAWAEFPLFEGV